MKILQVITSLITAGAEKIILDLVPRMIADGHQVEVCAFDSTRFPFYEELERKGVKIYSFHEGMKQVYNPMNILRLRKLIKNGNYDIVHTHNTAPQLFAAIGKTGNYKLVTTEHSTSTRRRNYRIFHFIDRWMYKAYDQIICISQPSEDSLRGYIGDGYPIKTILNGVDVQNFVNATPTDLNLEGKKIITMVAGFRYEKDHPTVIRSLSHLPQDYHLVLVGDGDRRAEFEGLIAELGLQDRAHLLGLRSDVPGILKSSDVVVMSSHREGLSLSNVEGMASGNPFVASDVEGLREVTDGYGVLFPHEDPKALADIVLRLTTDEQYRESVVKKCQERAMQYDISTMAKRYNEVYESLMNNGKN